MAMNQDMIAELKSSHFDFGGYNLKENHSQYKHHYRGTPSDTVKVDASNFSASHLKFGDYTSKNFYVSAKDMDYTKPVGAEVARMNDDKKRDLRSHHFNFGGWGPAHNTTSADTYTKKDLDCNLVSSKQDQVNKMRKHNFELGNSNKTYRTSAYGSSYQPVDKNILTGGPSKEQLKERMLELRETHLVLGQDPKQHQTTMKQAYTYDPNFQSGPVKLNRSALQGSHFDLGHANNDMQSMNRVSYQNPEHDNAASNEEKERLMRELRSHHFSLGDQEADYGTQSKVAYKDHGKNKDLGLNFKVEDSLQLGDKSANMLKASHYQKEMVPFAVSSYGPNDMKVRDANSDRRENWSMQHFGGSWMSEVQNHYGNPNVNHISNKNNNRDLKEKLMASNIYNGPNDENRFLSEAHSKFDTKDDPNARGVMDPKLKADLRASHYQIGENEHIEKHSEYNTKFYKDSKAPIKKEAQIVGQPAFRLGNKNGDYRTIYRANYNLNPF